MQGQLTDAGICYLEKYAFNGHLSSLEQNCKLLCTFDFDEAPVGKTVVREHSTMTYKAFSPMPDSRISSALILNGLSADESPVG